MGTLATRTAMGSRSRRESLTRAAAVQGTLGVQLTGPQPTGSGKLGYAGPLYWWTPPSSYTMENDQATGTTIFDTNNNNFGPPHLYYHVTLAESSGNCALQIHFDPASNLKAGSEGGWEWHSLHCASLWGRQTLHVSYQKPQRLQHPWSKTKKQLKETILFMFHNPRLELRIIGKLFFVHVRVIE